VIRLIAMRKLLIALFLLGSAARADAKVRVVTSIETFADLARQVGGDRADVQSLSKGYTDPHFVEPKPSLVITLNRADLLVHVGLELEIGWLPPLVLGSRNERIQTGMPGNLDASAAIPVLDVPATKVDRSMGDIHPQGNPHYYIAPPEASIVAHEIAQRLEEIDPAGKATYEKNLAAFEQKLKEKRAQWEAEAAPLRGLKVVTYHKSWSYVSKWLGLQEIGYLEPKPGIPPPPSHIAALIGRMRSDGVKVLIMESFYPRSTAELVSQKAGAKVALLPANVGGTPEAKDYFSLVDQIVKILLQTSK
jgi:zinc/manganese transport system substrate-binding protein